MTNQLYGAQKNGVIIGLNYQAGYDATDETVKHLWFPVPEGTMEGAMLVEGEWINPTPTPKAETDPLYLTQVDRNEFYQLFTVHEEAAIRTLAKTDAVTSVLVNRLDNSTNVNLTLPTVQGGLGLLAQNPATLLTEERVAHILARVYPTLAEMNASGQAAYAWAQAHPTT